MGKPSTSFSKYKASTYTLRVKNGLYLIYIISLRLREVYFWVMLALLTGVSVYSYIQLVIQLYPGSTQHLPQFVYCGSSTKSRWTELIINPWFIILPQKLWLFTVILLRYDNDDLKQYSRQHMHMTEIGAWYAYVWLKVNTPVQTVVH